jgi:hypothetical protein
MITRSLTLALTIFTLSLAGCGKTPQQKEADEGNALVASTGTLAQQLYDNYQINVMPATDLATTQSKAKGYGWAIWSNDDRKAIEGKLAAIVGNINRIFEIGSHKGITLKNNGGYDLGTLQLNANAYLTSLRNYNNVAKR